MKFLIKAVLAGGKLRDDFSERAIFTAVYGLWH